MACATAGPPEQRDERQQPRQVKRDSIGMLLDEAESLGLRIGTDFFVVDPGLRVSELAPALDLYWLTSEPRSEGIPTTVEEAMARRRSR